jgi:hypothetical protein
MTIETAVAWIAVTVAALLVVGGALRLWVRVVVWIGGKLADLGGGGPR